MNVYKASEWEHGLCCIDCRTEFEENQSIRERLVAMTSLLNESAFVVEIICDNCADNES